MRQIRQAQALDFLGMKALDEAAAGDVPPSSVIAEIRSAMASLTAGRAQVTYGPDGEVTDVTIVI